MIAHKKLNRVQRRIKEALEAYTGRPVAMLATCDDPQVAGTYAIRYGVGDGRVREALLTDTIDEHGGMRGALELAMRIEDCEFKTWPPTSNGR